MSRRMKRKNMVKILVACFAVSIFMGCKECDKNDPNSKCYEEPVLSSTPIFTINGVSFEMILVEGGTFTMGATPEQGSDAHAHEKPAHSVTLSDFYIGKYEVTQKLWQAITGTTLQQQSESCTFPGDIPVGKGENYPMYYINYGDCEKFCAKLNELLSNQLPKGHKFALLTEAQWEYAARGGNKSQGYKYSGSNNVGNVAWYRENSGGDYGTTHPVGTKDPNELGIYDMSGNACEWCSDWYDASYYSNSPATNPTGPASGVYRLHRGGCMSSVDIAEETRVSSRIRIDRNFRVSGLGFRLALVK